MELKTYFAQDQHGEYLPGANCYLYVRGTESLVSGLAQENGLPLSNPFLARSDARIIFAAPNGLYDLRVVLGNRDYRFSVQLNDVSEDVQAAKASAAQAESARDVAVTNANIYQDVATGMAQTSNLQYFSVPSSQGDEHLILYQKTAGAALEIKRYPSAKAVAKSVKSYPTRARMSADLSSEEGVRAIVTNDVDASNNGWYEKVGAEGLGSWQWIIDQPVTANKTERIFSALDNKRVPGVAWSVGDGHGAHPILLRENGVTELNAVKTENLTLQGSEMLKTLGIAGVAMALLDALGTSPWFVKDSGTSCFSAVETGALSVAGVDVLEALKHAGAARKTDVVMGNSGLIPLYPDMTKVSGWGSSSLDYLSAQVVSVLAEIAPGTTYYNGAKAGETVRGIAGRLGSIPMLISITGGSLPASGSVAATCSNVAPNAMMRPFTGTLAGVAGTLSSDGSKFTFTRTEAGSAVSVPNGTPFLPDVGPKYRDGVGLLWMGKNDIPTTDTAAEIANRTDVSFDYFTPYVKRMIVLGHFANPSWLGGPLVTKVLQVNALHAARYGSNYVDVLSYLESSKVWTDTGITPTPEDLVAQAGHCLAPSLTDDGVHFNAKLNAAFAVFLKDKLISLGWFK